jgi:hypothetical protein
VAASESALALTLALTMAMLALLQVAALEIDSRSALRRQKGEDSKQQAAGSRQQTKSSHLTVFFAPLRLCVRTLVSLLIQLRENRAVHNKKLIENSLIAPQGRWCKSLWQRHRSRQSASIQALKGRNNLFRPFRALMNKANLYLWRCPRLSYFAPLGLSWTFQSASKITAKLNFLAFRLLFFNVTLAVAFNP